MFVQATKPVEQLASHAANRCNVFVYVCVFKGRPADVGQGHENNSSASSLFRLNVEYTPCRTLYKARSNGAF